MGMMWGWLRAAAVRASRLNRSTMPSPMSKRAGASTLIATLRSRARSWARYTVAMPPRPSSARISYSPSVAWRRASSWALCSTGGAWRTGGATVAPPPLGATGTLVPQRRQKYAPGAREVPQRAQKVSVSGAIKACRAVLYPITHGLPAGNSLPGTRFQILAEHRGQRWVALEDRLHVRDRDGRHLAARLERGAADVWQQHGARRRTQAGMDRRLLEIDIEPRPTQPARFEGLRERFLADQVTARRVDQDGARLHVSQQTPVDDALGLRHRRHVERQDMALFEKPRELDSHRTALPLEVRPRIAGRVENPHPERHRTAPHCLADPSGAEQAEGTAAQLDPEQQLGMPPGPRPALHQLGAGHPVSGAGADQRPGEIGGRVGEDVGSVRDRDAAHLGGHDVHVVVPHGAVRHNLQLGKALEVAATHPSRQERYERDVVARRSRLLRREPGDSESGQLVGLEQPLELGGDEDAVTHYLLICARRIESSTASARAGFHL